MKRLSGIEFIFLFIATMATGWVWNIVKLFETINGPFSAEVVMRILGVFILPLGSIIGYL